MVTEDEMVGCNHGLNGHDFEQTMGDGKGQGSLECCSPLGQLFASGVQTVGASVPASVLPMNIQG